MRLFKSDPIAKLEKELAKKLEHARDAQRTGKLDVYASLSAEAEAIGQKIDQLRQPD